MHPGRLVVVGQAVNCGWYSKGRGWTGLQSYQSVTVAFSRHIPPSQVLLSVPTLALKSWGTIRVCPLLLRARWHFLIPCKNFPFISSLFVIMEANLLIRVALHYLRKGSWQVMRRPLIPMRFLSLLIRFVLTAKPTPASANAPAKGVASSLADLHWLTWSQRTLRYESCTWLVLFYLVLSVT